MDMCYNGSTGIRPLSRLALSHGGGVFSFDSTAAPAVDGSVLFSPRSSKRSASMQSVGSGRIVGWVRWLAGWVGLVAASHVWLLLLVKCLFVGESFTLWATQCTWTGTPPGRHTTSGSLKVLWHRWHPFLSDTKMGFFLSFSWNDTRWGLWSSSRQTTYWCNIASYNYEECWWQWIDGIYAKVSQDKIKQILICYFFNLNQTLKYSENVGK